MKQKLLNLHNKILSLSSVKLILYMFFVILVLQILVSPLQKIDPIEQSNIELIQNQLGYDYSFLFRASIISPLFETLLFQTLIIKFIWFWTRIFFEDKSFGANVIPIVISAIVFGILHYYGYETFAKVISTFFIGLVFAYTYVVAYLSNKKASICVMALHSLWNTFIIIFNYFILYLSIK